jgi:hypothetical protein
MKQLNTIFFSKRLSLLLSFILIYLLAGHLAFGQNKISEAQEKKSDATSEKKEAAAGLIDNGNVNPENDQDQKKVKDTDREKANNKDQDKSSVKQVRSDHPDMSRSKGARPPDIVRPSGSRIPKGVGRPAGAGRRGRG